MDVLAMAAAQTSLTEASAISLLAHLGGVKEVSPASPRPPSTESSEDALSLAASTVKKPGALLPGGRLIPGASRRASSRSAPLQSRRRLRG